MADRRLALWSGLLYLVPLFLGPFVLLVAPGRPEWHQAAIAAGVLVCAAELALTVTLYRLFAPGSPTLALVAAAFRGTMTVLQAANLVVLDPQALLVWQSFFGVHCVLLGVVAARSGFVPRALGPLLGVAGLGYLADSAGKLFFPGFAEALGWVVGLTAVAGEVPFLVWLIVHGLRKSRLEQSQDR